MTALMASNSRWHGVAAVLALAAAVVGISIVLVVQQGRARTAEASLRVSGSATVIPMPSVLPPARLRARVRVAIIRDPGSATYYDQPARLDTILNSWKDALRAVGADVSIVSATKLWTHSDASVLVVPASPCLGVAAREALERAIALGRGVIITWLAGVRDGGCRHLGYGLITKFTRAARADTLEKREMVYVTFPHGGPLATDIPPGARLDLHPDAYVALRHPARDAYYSGFTLEPQSARTQTLVDGAVVHAEHGRGRVVYLGFEPGGVVDLPWNRAILALLLRNSVAWAAGQPLVSVEPWPRGHDAAVVIAQDVEYQFANARHAMDSLREAGVRGTYFLTSNLALRQKSLARDLAAQGEVGTHSEDHRPLGGLPQNVQRSRLERTRRDLKRLIGTPVSGLRPPQEQFDAATLAAWLEAGGTYVFGANNSRAAAPELLAIAGDTLVLLGRVSDDDFGVVGPLDRASPELARARILHDFAKVQSLGGLYVLSYHSQLLARRDLVPALAAVARTLASDSGVWLATGGEIDRWWRARADVRADVVSSDQNRIVISVSNHGSVTVAGAVVRVAIGQRRRVQSATVPLLEADEGIARLSLEPLGPGVTRRVELRLVNASRLRTS